MFDIGTLAVEWFAAGTLLVVLGGLIRFAGWTFLLAGYDQTSSVPDNVVANIAGNTILRVGLATFGFGAIATYLDPPSYLPVIFEVIILLAIVRLIYRLHTYTPAESV